MGNDAVVASDLALPARVVRNFLANAIRYTGRGNILLGCRRRPEGLEILVRDSGPGIPEAQREAIFQEFQRLGGNRDAEDRGLGLGLAIVDRIAGRGRGIQAGRVWTNCYHQYPAHAAFGGYKKSGVGRETHKVALELYQQAKKLLVSYDVNPLGFF